MPDEKLPPELEKPELKEEWMKRPEVLGLVERFNRRYFVVSNFGRSFRVCWETETPYDVEKFGARWELEYLDERNFNAGHRNKLVKVREINHPRLGTVEPRFMTESKAWLDHPWRRQYEGVVFQPGGEKEVGGDWNLWQGFAFRPAKGDCSLYLAHVFDNVCRGNRAKYGYLIKWMAHQVRHPDSVGQVAICVSGRKGTGKNEFAEKFMRLWGNQGLLLSESARVTSHFNAHLRHACVLVADEAFFAADPRQDALLKSLITSDSITIEAKGVDAVRQRSYLKFIILSNDSHIARATSDERRYSVFEIGDGHIKDIPYFRAIDEQMKAGGYGALLWHLMNEVDLEGFDVRRALDTAELTRNKAESLRNDEELVYDLLLQGSVPCGRIESGSAPCDLVHPDSEPCTEIHVRNRMLVSLDALVEHAHKTQKGRYKRVSRRGLQELLGNHGLQFASKNLYTKVWDKIRKKEVRGPRRRFFDLLTLTEARHKWDKHFFKGDWPKDDDGEWDEATHGEWTEADDKEITDLGPGPLE